MSKQSPTRTQNQATRAVHTSRKPESRRLSLLEWSVLAAIVAAIVFATLAAAQPAGAESYESTQIVRVRPSQTLWDIAQSHPIDGKSTPQVVEVIRAMNDLQSASLATDQLLELPASADAVAMAAR